MTIKYETSMGKDLFTILKEGGYLVYGGAFTGKKVQFELGIEIPNVGTKTTFDNLALVELSAIGYVRNELLKQGMYLKKDGDDYRILLPSQNAEQVRNFLNSADRKLLRALKLSKNNPDRTPEHDVVEARLHMRRDSIREDMRQAAAMT